MCAFTYLRALEEEYDRLSIYKFYRRKRWFELVIPIRRKARCINNGVWFHRWLATSQKRACTDVTETLLNKQNLLVISRLLARRRQVVSQSAFQSPASNFSSVQKVGKPLFNEEEAARAKGTKKISHAYTMCVESCNYRHKRDEMSTWFTHLSLRSRRLFSSRFLYNIPYKIELPDILIKNVKY